jgi:hypothetical protein
VPLEVVGGRLILHGCGDLLDDYEDIAGYEEFRPDLRLMYFPVLDAATGRLCSLRLAPVRMQPPRLPGGHALAVSHARAGERTVRVAGDGRGARGRARGPASALACSEA